MSIPLPSTSYSPVGAWSSFTFGNAGQGATIGSRFPGKAVAADFIVAVQRGGADRGQTRLLPFVKAGANYPGWSAVDGNGVARSTSPCVDEYAAAEAGVTLRVYTPHPALPNPKRSGNLQYSTVPGVLLEVVINNTESEVAATAFVGLKLGGEGLLRPVDWSSKALCGVGQGGDWLLAATAVKGEVYTVLADDLAKQAMGEGTVIEGRSGSGGIAIKVAPRTTRTVHLVMAFFDGGSATQGIAGRYLYTAYFQRVETVANFILQNQAKIRESCASLDGRVAAACSDPLKVQLFAQGVRAYEATTQLTDADGVPYFTTIGRDGQRNALSRAIDQLPWELFRNPWVIRNIFDLGTTSYSYQDKVRFGGEAELREGGLTFTHDFGLESCYTPTGSSASEQAGGQGRASATESLLNGVYLLTSYALLADDTPWSKTRLPFARELLTSMENRDHWDPEQRNGILKGTSDRAAGEVTVFAGMGPALETVPGNLYLAVKTFCANLMLTTYFQGNNDLHSADYSYAFAQKTAAALVAAFDEGTGVLKANLVDGSLAGEKMIAALEPLAVPTYLGLTSTLAEYFPELFGVLKRHAEGCLRGGCVDGAGGLRLSSGSPAGMGEKVVSVLFVLERLFGIDVQAMYPGMWEAAASGGGAITAALYVKQAPVREAAEVTPG